MMKGKKAFIVVLAVLAAFMLVLPSGAWAYLYVVDFVGSGSGNTGSISYTGGATPLMATNTSGNINKKTGIPFHLGFSDCLR